MWTEQIGPQPGNKIFDRNGPFLGASIVPPGTQEIDTIMQIAVVVFSKNDNPVVVPLSGWATWSNVYTDATHAWVQETNIAFAADNVDFDWTVGINWSFYFLG
jgi:hypothetical protein